MDEHAPAAAENGGGISARTMEIVVAVIIFLLGALVVVDSYRLGSKWGSDGPESGYFPFYIGMLLCIASLAVLLPAIAKPVMKGELFVTWGPLKLVMTVLLPALVYVLAVQYVGIYVASSVYIAVFMVWLGHYSWLRSVAVGVGVSVVVFMMFEIWFKVPLFKGELNPLSFLGY